MADRILIIDTDSRVAGFAARELAYLGYSVDVRPSGEAGLSRARHDAPDLVIVNRDLPGIGGLDVCRLLRSEGNLVPVLILSDKGAPADRISGFNAGADDYLVSPFAFDELVARIRALLRRHSAALGGGQGGQILRLADLVMNTATREVRRGERLLALTAREFDLLELFLRHPSQVLTREIIYDRIWGYDFSGESNIIEVYVRYLRIKLEADGEPRLLQTVRGVGYALREE